MESITPAYYYHNELLSVPAYYNTIFHVFKCLMSISRVEERFREREGPVCRLSASSEGLFNVFHPLVDLFAWAMLCDIEAKSVQ